MSSLRKFELGAFTEKNEGTPTSQFNNNPAPPTPGSGLTSGNNTNTSMMDSTYNNSTNNPNASLTPREGMAGAGGVAAGTPQQQQQQTPQPQQPAPPKLHLQGQRPLDRKYLYSSSTVRFVGYIHTSEVFVEGKAGGINSDLLDKATARGGQDPADAVTNANRVWKERTFVVEPSVKGWTLHVLKAKLGGETTVKHSILLSEVENIDIMTSQQPGRKFSVKARTTADTQAKTHFVLDFQSYIVMSLGKQHLEITCKNPDAVIRNYTFLVNSLQATAVLTQRFSALKAAEEKIDKEQVSMHMRADGGGAQQDENGNALTVPLKFECAFSLSTKPHEPYVQLRGAATISTAMFQTAATANKKPENIKIQGKFRILLHPHNLHPPMTEEGVIFLVQSDEQHMLPVEIRPIPGKSKKVLDNETLKQAVVTAIDNMIVIGEAMSGPRLAVEALTKPATAQGSNSSHQGGNATNTNNNNQLSWGGAAASSPSHQSSPMNNNNNNNNNPFQPAGKLGSTVGSHQDGSSSSSSPSRNNNNLPVIPGKASGQIVVPNNMNNNDNEAGGGGGGGGASNLSPGGRWNVLNATSRLAFNNSNSSPQQRGFGAGSSSSTSYHNINQRYNQSGGNIVEQLEAGTRARLEHSFLELLRSLIISSIPPRGSFPSSHRLAMEQNTPNNSNSNQHPLATSPRFMHHQMQRNGSVPIAVSQIAGGSNTSNNNNAYKVAMDPQSAERIMQERNPQQHQSRGDVQEYFGGGSSNNNSPAFSRSSYASPSALLSGAWDFKHSNTWPLTMPGDDPQDFRLHLARILKRRAGKSLTDGARAVVTNSSVGANNNQMNSSVLSNNSTSSTAAPGSPTRSEKSVSFLSTGRSTAGLF